MTAEFAMVLTVIAFLLSFVMLSANAAMWKVRLGEASAQAVRLLARGESEEQAVSLARDLAGDTISVQIDHSGSFITVTTTASSGPLISFLGFHLDSTAKAIKE